MKTALSLTPTRNYFACTPTPRIRTRARKGGQTTPMAVVAGPGARRRSHVDARVQKAHGQHATRCATDLSGAFACRWNQRGGERKVDGIGEKWKEQWMESKCDSVTGAFQRDETMKKKTSRCTSDMSAF